LNVLSHSGYSRFFLPTRSQFHILALARNAAQSYSSELAAAVWLQVFWVDVEIRGWLKMRSFKRVAFCCGFALLNVGTPGWLLAQEVVINGKDFESGAADAKLAEIARQAAATGKTVVVTTPPYWQAQAIAKLHAGASGVQLKTSDAFFENVLVRVVGNDAPKPVVDSAAKVADAARAGKPIDTSKAADAKPTEPKPARPAVLAKAALANVDPPRVAAAPAAPSQPIVEVSKSQPALVAQDAAPAPKPVTVAKVEAPPAPSAPPVVVVPAPPPVAEPVAPPASSATASKAASQNVAEARQRLETQLGLGKNLDGSLKVEQLQKGDQIFVQGPARAIVRRNGSRTQLFWLEGALNLERTEIAKTDAGRYRVEEQIRNVAAPTLRAMHTAPVIFTAQIPAEKTKIREDIERHFNEGKNIADRLHTDQLQYSDLVYCYRTYAIILRRTDSGFDRYWLDGPIDLNQAGVVKDGDAYRVVSDRL
jgi:hypothetical protein